MKVGDLLSINNEWQVGVKALSDKRGPATEARKLYEESEAGRAERERRADLRGSEPARALKGRPTKRDRRLIEKLPVLEPDPADDSEP